MPADERGLDDLAGAILDGTPIDWASAAETLAMADRSLLEQFQLVAAVAHLHRHPVTRIRGVDTVRDSQHWGHLRLLERLGRGAFGEVYRAWDTRLEREVALKLLFRAAGGADSRATSIVEEGRLLARVRHPNVLTIYGAERIDDRVGLWTELVRGRTLAQLLEERKTFSAAECAAIGVDLCAAVGAVHGEGLLHRDIKAQNVMLAENGRVVLMDFGSGWEMDVGPSTLAGTPLYLAPELLEGSGATVRSEIYGLGVLLYHLLTGSYPVRADGLRHLKLAHERRDRIDVRTVRPDLSRKFARIIDRATDPEPDRRHGNVHELAADLSTLTARSRRRRMAVLVAAAALATTVWMGWEIRGRQAAETVTAIESAARAARVPFDRTRVVAINKGPGDKFHPTLSPDGREVAFLLPRNSDTELHLQSVAGGGSRKVFSAAALAFPAWAPDGGRVALVSRSTDQHGRMSDEVITVDARDGSSAVVLKSPGVFLWTGLDWSPDGSHIVVATRNSTSEPWRLMRIPLTAGERRWMSTPPAGSLGDCYPAYSPDGASIAFIRDTGSERSLMLRDLARGAESQLTSASSDISRPVWTMDGRHLIYSTYVAAGNAANSLWTVATSGGEPRRIIGTGDGAGYPSTARHTERLAYLQTRVDYNLYKADLSKRPPAVVAFPGSSQMDSSPDVSPDGSRVVFVSDRSGPTEIWTMAVDGSDARPVTTMNGHTRRPRWSPDGRQVAFDARASGSYHTDIYVVNARGGEPRRLTTDVSQDTWATWSADGQWIYYLRHVRGSPEIWKVPAAGGPPEQITHDHGLSAQESTDGRFLYYSTAARELWRVRLGGGVRQLMLKMPSRTEWGGLWTVTDAGIYWLNADGSPHPAIDFLSFATGRSSRAFTPPGSVAMGSNISVSRDRRLLLLAQLDYGSSDVMMLEAGEPRSR